MTVDELGLKPFLLIALSLSCCSWSPTTTGPPRPSAANYVAIDAWSPGPIMAAMDDPLCRKRSSISKPAQWDKTVAGIPVTV